LNGRLIVTNGFRVEIEKTRNSAKNVRKTRRKSEALKNPFL